MTNKNSSWRESYRGMDAHLLDCIEDFRKREEVAPEAEERVAPPTEIFIGNEVLNKAAAALLEGENLLLVGSKATGKNILADNLAWMFGRPVYSMSFHVNTDSEALIGTDTFIHNEVCLREGPVTLCAKYGGFGILDEINMAKSDAVAVLHAALDYRRVIDIPGYRRVVLHPATRFIATMNYGYTGTRELNEALISRFVVIQMPSLSEEELSGLLGRNVPGADEGQLRQFAALFLDLQEKAQNGEISTHGVDLRGLIAALRMIRSGISPVNALDMGIAGKCFDSFERQLVTDVIKTRFADSMTAGEVFR